MVLITASCTMLWIFIHSSSGTLSIRSNPLNLSLPLYNHKVFDLGHNWMAFNTIRGVLKARILKYFAIPFSREEGMLLKHWCFWTVMLENTLESPLDYKEIQPSCPKGNQFSMFPGRTDAKAETSIFCSPDVMNWLTGKDPNAGKDWTQEKGMTEDKMVGWHHWLGGHEIEQALGVGDGQGSLVCCHPWGHKVRYDWATELTDWLIKRKPN